MDTKENAVQHIERDNGSNEADSEKAVPQTVYPMTDEDYVVTTKTWVVVTILASAYGVSSHKITYQSRC